MSPLDRFARRVLSRWCSTRTLERVVDAIIADTDHERQQALAQGRRWQARLVGMRGSLTLCRATAVQAVHALASFEPEPARRAGQAVWIGVTLSLVSTILLATLPNLGMFAHHTGDRWLLLLYLLPSALPLGLTVGPVVAACWAGGVRRGITRRVRGRVWTATLVCSTLAVVLLSWATPMANQRVRELLFPHRLLVPRGVAELPLWELGRVANGDTRPLDLMPHETQATALLAMHGRVALALGPVLLTFVAVGVGRHLGGAPTRLGGGFVVLALYMTWWFGVARAEAPEHRYVLAAWTPGLLAACTGLLLRLRWSTSEPA